MLEQKIDSLRAPLVNAQEQLQPGGEIIDDQGGDAHSYNDENVDSWDDNVKEGKRPDSGYFSDSGRWKKQGRPLSAVLEDSGLFGKALSFAQFLQFKVTWFVKHSRTFRLMVSTFLYFRE